MNWLTSPWVKNKRIYLLIKYKKNHVSSAAYEYYEVNLETKFSILYLLIWYYLIGSFCISLLGWFFFLTHSINQFINNSKILKKKVDYVLYKTVSCMWDV